METREYPLGESCEKFTIPKSVLDSFYRAGQNIETIIVLSYTKNSPAELEIYRLALESLADRLMSNASAAYEMFKVKEEE